MSSIKSFLQILKTIDNPVKWVTGNQSADMDSVISAISYSYFQYKYDASICFPLINIPRQDFKLRRDINLILSNYDIHEDLLYFIEDIEKLNTEVLDISLVDHCNLQGDTLINRYKNNQVKVTSIIDHHADENVFVDANPRIIRSCGSCSSLVFNYWFKKLDTKNISLHHDEILNILLAPLLIDTSNMSSKVEEPDVQALEKYKELITITESTNFFKTIKDAKKDLSGFKVNEILRKDYKQFNFNNNNVGFSSIGKSCEWIFKNYSNEEIVQGLNNVVDFYKLDLLIITPSYTDKSDQYRREFIMFHSKGFDDLPSKVPNLELNDDVYNIEKFRSRLLEVGISVKNQSNLSASRKQIVPEVQKALL